MPVFISKERLIILIVFEGLDGCGKTTQAALLTRRLQNTGFDILQTKEPGGSDLAEVVKPSLLHGSLHPVTELILFAALRSEHVLRRIKPALAAGKHVICDRYTLSSYAFQGALPEIDAAMLHNAIQLGSCGLYPDLTIFIDVPAEFYHSGGTEKDQISERGTAYRDQVRQRYWEAVNIGQGRFIVVDGTKPVETVSDQIWINVLRHLAKEQ